MKTSWKIAFVLALLVSCHFPFAAAEEAGSDADPTTLRRINANRSLLGAATAEYEKLKASYETDPSDRTKRDMEKAEYKIKALNEDSARLLAMLPEETKADELVKYVLQKDSIKKQSEMDTAMNRLDEAAKAPNEETERYYKLHERALELVAQGLYEEALKIYEDVLLIRPDDDQAYMIMGHLFMMTGQFGRAEKAFFSAAEINPDNVHEIAPFYQGQILKSPGDDNAHAHLGYVYLMFKDYEAAGEAFNDALSINPDNSVAQSGLETIFNLQTL